MGGRAMLREFGLVECKGEEAPTTKDRVDNLGCEPTGRTWGPASSGTKGEAGLSSGSGTCCHATNHSAPLLNTARLPGWAPAACAKRRPGGTAAAGARRHPVAMWTRHAIS